MIKKSFHYLTFAAFAFLTSMEFVEGLKCYHCRIENDFGDEGCDGNPPPESYLRECAQPQCWMRYTNNASNSYLHYERFCSAMSSENGESGCIAAMILDDSGSSHSALECTCSQEDGCNGYTPIGGSDPAAAGARPAKGS